jgi:16S rRNA processing protein RimM
VADTRFFEVGVVTGAFGLKGEIKVFPVTDDPSRFNLLKELHIDGQTSFKIERLRFHKNMVIIKPEGVDNAAKAKAMRGLSLMIPPELALPLDDDQYYHRDLLDMEVVTDNGEELGILTKIISTGANDVYTVTLKKGGELLIPAIKQCVTDVDVLSNRMTVRLLKGL